MAAFKDDDQRKLTPRRQRRIFYRPLHPDKPGTRLRFIAGTDQKYGVSKNGNVYRVDGEPRVPPDRPPLSIELPNRYRTLARVCIRLKTDKKRISPKHSVPWLVVRAWGKYPELDEGRFDILYENGDPRDNRFSNLYVTTKRGPRLRHRLPRVGREVLELAVRTGRWSNEDLARAFRTFQSVMDGYVDGIKRRIQRESEGGRRGRAA